ncbi:MAG: SEC-C metal-binding domain-containing protein [Bacillota bacterium]|nr:SEC-C metal-binding domain-containing protein [Bacillota bacterium]
MRTISAKIGRNSPCPCGSGKKYKKCCLDKSEEQKFAEAIINTKQSIRNDARIKRCLHPNKMECDGKIVKAHAIQNNRILDKISVDGHIITLDGTANLIFQDSQIKGRKIATTFTGFCSYHDKILFQDIEDQEFTESPKQVFLITYRTMAWHYHKKQEQANANNIEYRKMLEQGFDLMKSEDYRDKQKDILLDLRDNEIEKLFFDNLLNKNDYDKVRCCIWELPYEVEFAVSMMHELEHDILGQQINNLELDANVKNIYLNIFPATSKSYCVWSWLEENNNVFVDFSKQFMALSIFERENYFNNQLPIWTDSIVISPRLWNNWGSEIQQALISHANHAVLYKDMEELNKYSYSDTPWNFFEKI